MTPDITQTRIVLRYHGGKFVLAPWIIRHFPQHVHYVEPFGGSAAILLKKAPSALETYNDLDLSAVTFFKVLRDRPDDLVQAVLLTPWSREEVELSRVPTDDDLERARRFYVVCNQTIGSSNGVWRTGWKYFRGPEGTNVMNQFYNHEGLLRMSARLQRVQIECDPATEVIQRYDGPDTFFYADPPYLHETRSRWAGKAYKYEMTAEDHEKLAQVLNAVQGKVILSGYASDLYARLYEDNGWQRVEQEAKLHSGESKYEALWLSPRVVKENGQGQLSLL